MAEAKNNFIRSKMNKDLDARILPKGEYRDARNVQVSKSEGDGVGSLENVLGNALSADFSQITGVSNLTCVGYFADEFNNNIYLFFTNYTDPTPSNLTYSPSAKNFIFSYNTVTKASTELVEGSFLNFSKTHFIYGVNVLEDLLFWTDNRNQPRKINISLASEAPNYYTNEDQISVATYNPYSCIELYRESLLASTATSLQHETTMLDVTSKFYPNGGSCTVDVAATYTAGTDIAVSSIEGNIYVGSVISGVGIPVGTKVTQVTSAAGTPIQLDADITTTSSNQEVLFEANPYYDASYNGDPNYLEDKFVRFSYRFNFIDGENSIFAPFTQPAFIPKQDGYFITNTPTASTVENNDEKETFQSTIVEFMENKVNKILLHIPLPFKNYEIEDSLKLRSIDILYKESDGLSVKVIEQIPSQVIRNSSARFQLNGNASTATFNIDNVQGGIQVGALVTGGSIDYNTTVVSFTPIDPSNPTAGVLEVSSAITVADGVTLMAGNTDYYVYDYQSRKPYKVLPESDLIRVYDKTPVRSFSQEIISNRVVYANFQDKHTPPATLDYNVNASTKANFILNEGQCSVLVGVTNADTFTITGEKGDLFDQGVNVVGSIVTTDAIGAVIPFGTVVVSYDPTTGIMVLSNNVTVSASDLLLLVPGSDTQNTTSIIEYPNHSLKENRNYQVGVVLSDRFGRQSSVILSSSSSSVTVDGTEFIGSTIFSPYQTAAIEPATWPGDSLKISFNNGIGPQDKSLISGWPGLYNGDFTSPKYNPLGWYSWKIVVKQTEQEYYNVYLPGIMASYPEEQTLEIGKTSHTVLINDNINKVPRDLSEVGPQQRQFRSSVQLFGRVENTDITVSTQDYNTQYYPGIKSDTVSIISTMYDLFDYSPTDVPRPNYFPQFYSYESNPLIARITTQSKIGQIASTGYDVASGLVDTYTAPNQVVLKNITGTPAIGMNATGGGLPEGVTIIAYTSPNVTFSQDITLSPDDVLSFSQAEDPGLQYLAVYETEPVESLLDIFWETSTSGLISTLNEAILYDNQGAAQLIGFTTANFTEGITIDSPINSGSGIALTNIFGANLPASDFELFLDSVVDQNGNDRSEDFELVPTTSGASTYNVLAKTLFWFGSDPLTRIFNFQFRAEMSDGTEPTFVEQRELINLEPEIINCIASINVAQLDNFVYRLEGKNGSEFFNTGGTEKYLAGQELEWEITSQYYAGFNNTIPDVPTPPQSNIFSLNPVTPDSNSINGGVGYVEINMVPGRLSGFYKIKVSLKDANASNGSLASTPPSCFITVNVVNENRHVWINSMRTSFDQGPVIDSTATVVAQISPTEFTFENLVGSNVQNQAAFLGQGGPILNKQGQGASFSGEALPPEDTPQLGATIKDVSSGSTLGKVSVVNYNATSEEILAGNYGTTGTVTTQANATVTPGQTINFSCGRWDVSLVSGHGITYTGQMHAGSVCVANFPYPDDPSTWVYSNTLFRCSPPNNPTVPNQPSELEDSAPFPPLFGLSSFIYEGTGCAGGLD